MTGGALLLLRSMKSDILDCCALKMSCNVGFGLVLFSRPTTAFQPAISAAASSRRLAESSLPISSV